MGKEYESYSITYRPYQLEFDNTEENFVEVFHKKFKKDDNKYIISRESAGKERPNHLQIYLRLSKPRRQDKMKKTLLNIVKDYELTSDKVALRVNGISRDESFSIGYVVKEYEDYNEMDIYNLSTDELDKAKEYYLDSIKNKKLSIDRVRINNKNICDCIDNYISHNPMLRRDKYSNRDIRKILGVMGNEGYYILPLLKGFKLNILYLENYLNKTLDKFLLKFDN